MATDADTAGRAAAARAFQLLTQRGIDLTAADLPGGGDPAEILQQLGPTGLTRVLLDRARPLAEQIINDHLDQWVDRLQWVEGRVGAVRAVAPIVARMPDVQAARQIDRILSRIDIDRATVQQEVRAAAGQSGMPAARDRIQPRQPPARSSPASARRSR